jgi:hypothetical protein
MPTGFELLGHQAASVMQSGSHVAIFYSIRYAILKLQQNLMSSALIAEAVWCLCLPPDKM